MMKNDPVIKHTKNHNKHGFAALEAKFYDWIVKSAMSVMEFGYEFWSGWPNCGSIRLRRWVYWICARIHDASYYNLNTQKIDLLHVWMYMGIVWMSLLTKKWWLLHIQLWCIIALMGARVWNFETISLCGPMYYHETMMTECNLYETYHIPEFFSFGGEALYLYLEWFVNNALKVVISIGFCQAPDLWMIFILILCKMYRLA